MDAQEALGISAPCQVIANACASGTNAIGHAFECVRSGRYQRVLTGGYDALSELVFVGFDSLQAATPEKCRPFDSGRTGLVLGEGAAVLALENFEAAEARGAKILAEVVGYGFSTDNHHLTQPNPSGSGAAPGDGTRARERGPLARRRSITSTRTAPRRRSTTPRKARRSPSCSAACRSARRRA